MPKKDIIYIWMIVNKKNLLTKRNLKKSQSNIYIYLLHYIILYIKKNVKKRK